MMMNSQSREMARVGLTIYSEEMSGPYQEARDLLSTQMSTAQFALDGMYEAVGQTQENIQLLQDFAAFLPAQEWHKPEGRGADRIAQVRKSRSAADVRRSLNSTIWLRQKQDAFTDWNGEIPQYAVTPHYLLGYKFGDKRTSSVILQPFSGEDANTRPVLVGVKTVGLQTFLSTSLTQEVPPATLTQVYDPRSGTCALNGETPGAFTYHSGYNKKDTHNLTPYYGGHTGYEPLKNGELSDSTLVAYSVLDCLNQLATVYGVADQYARLLDQ